MTELRAVWQFVRTRPGAFFGRSVFVAFGLLSAAAVFGMLVLPVALGLALDSARRRQQPDAEGQAVLGPGLHLALLLLLHRVLAHAAVLVSLDAAPSLADAPALRSLALLVSGAAAGAWLAPLWLVPAWGSARASESLVAAVPGGFEAAGRIGAARAACLGLSTGALLTFPDAALFFAVRAGLPLPLPAFVTAWVLLSGVSAVAAATMIVAREQAPAAPRTTAPARVLTSLWVVPLWILVPAMGVLGVACGMALSTPLPLEPLTAHDARDVAAAELVTRPGPAAQPRSESAPPGAVGCPGFPAPAPGGSFWHALESSPTWCDDGPALHCRFRPRASAQEVRIANTPLRVRREGSRLWVTRSNGATELIAQDWVTPTPVVPSFAPTVLVRRNPDTTLDILWSLDGRVRVDASGRRVGDGPAQRLLSRLGGSGMALLLLSLFGLLRLERALQIATARARMLLAPTWGAAGGRGNQRLEGTYRADDEGGGWLDARGGALRVRLPAGRLGRSTPGDGQPVTLVGDLRGLAEPGFRDGAHPWPDGARLLRGSGEAATRAALIDSLRPVALWTVLTTTSAMAASAAVLQRLVSALG